MFTVKKPTHLCLSFVLLYEVWLELSHSDPQSTVVYSRVRHTQILDYQRNWFWRCVDMCNKSVFELFIFISSLTNSLEHIFRNSVYFLLILKESRGELCLICAVDYYSSTFINSSNSCFLLNTVLWLYSCRQHEQINVINMQNNL